MTPRHVPARAAALAIAGLLGAAEPLAAEPMRRPGLWELTMQTTGAPSRRVRHCVDARTDRAMQRFGQTPEREACTREAWHRDGEVWIGESECRVGRSVAATRSRFAGDFHARYKGEVDTVFTPPLASITRSRVTVAGRWLGPCPKGWAPGDMDVPGMGRVNVVDRFGAPRPER